MLCSIAVCEDVFECVMTFRGPQVYEKLEFSMQSYNNTELLDAKTFQLGNTQQLQPKNEHVLFIYILFIEIVLCFNTLSLLYC